MTWPHKNQQTQATSTKNKSEKYFLLVKKIYDKITKFIKSNVKNEILLHIS